MVQNTIADQLTKTGAFSLFPFSLNISIIPEKKYNLAIKNKPKQNTGAWHPFEATTWQIKLHQRYN